MRMFNFNDAIVAGKSMVNGKTAVCAKSNLHRVEPDALRLYLRGRSVLSTRSDALIPSGAFGASDQGTRAISNGMFSSLVNGLRSVGDFGLNPAGFESKPVQNAGVKQDWQIHIAGPTTQTTTLTQTVAGCWMPCVAGSTVGMSLS